MNRIFALMVVALFLIFPALAEQPRPPLADTMRELLARHVEWHAYDVSSNFVTFVPLGNGVTTKSSNGLPKKLSDAFDIFLHSVTGNSDNSLRGELRYMKKEKKNGMSDTLSAFKSLMKGSV
jgi:hypothetical protein